MKEMLACRYKPAINQKKECRHIPVMTLNSTYHDVLNSENCAVKNEDNSRKLHIVLVVGNAK